MNYRYPLIQLDPYIYSAQGQGLNSNISIYIKTFTTVDSITVPLTVKENSLTVNINGVKYTDFTHDTDSGKISFKKQITPLDDIVIYYKEDSSIGNGNLLLSYGSKYNINENLSLELSNTGNWNLSKEEYTYSTNENIGNLSSKVEVNYKNSYLSGRLTSESVISTPDTLGKYLLFSYSTSNLIIPLLSTEIGISDSQLDLIKRIDNDIFLETSDIQKLAPDDSGGAYYINHVIGNSVFDVIVLESDEIGSGLSASLNLNLKDYKDNYSWATKFNINLLSSLSDRDITIKFINPDLPDNNVLSKAIRVNKSDTYQEYTVDFTEEERAKLKYISNIVIQLNEGSKSLILLKSISFTGDSLVKHQGSNSYTVSSLSEDMIIKTTGTTDGKDIEIGSKISPIDITQYKKLNMTITNSGLFKGDTSFNLNLKNRGEVVASITIPGSYIEIGNNRIEVDLDNKTINNNNNTIGTFDITGSGIVDSISYNISNYEISSELRLSPIVLSEPVTDFYNQSGIKLEYTPNLSLTWKDREILSNFVLTTSNYFNYSDRNSYLLSADIRFTLLEKDVKAGIIFDDTIKELNYFVSLPTLQLPLSISDSFIYSSNSYRNSKLNLDTKYLDLRIDLEDTTGSESGKRVSQFELELKNEESYLLIIDSQLTQLRNDSIDILNSEIGQSYYKIIPKNTLDLSNNLNSSLSFLLKKSIFEINSLQSTSYKQVKYPDNIGSNNYYGDISITLDLKDIKLKPKISTDYSFLESSSINNLEEGVKNHLSKFLEYNPYKELSFSDIFYSGNGLDFYYNDDLFLNKKLNSLLSLEIENNIETSINLFIPNNITYSLNKTYTDDATREETNIINSLDLGFTSSRSLKNSFTANNSYNIENKSNTFSFQWKLIYYKELFKDYILDITNDLMLKENSFSTLLKTNFNWPGKSGPLLITPLFDKVLDKPYNYKHEEALYLNFDQLDSKFGVGFRHETVLNVKDINKTSFYIDVGYKNYSTVKLSLELGIYTTIIF
ncbi:hypothetical protein EW093_03605 [Thiospirochaeta perfilievii]|uniref:Uncharacterized protein n=1 Tax=Thiospirochaeta perfilievii TaxID=252967 RepID=A0A5C1QC76_9SPIO|nr:hypothetical protein [Thiospirochaeta perfilievii]QEN03822.1 hypothetical protein EW093_03605 [Thiospirochaeta perfilievii]